MVVVLVFRNDDRAASEAYCTAIRERFPTTYLEALEFDFDRPAGLRADWQAPRKFIDYWPSAAELSDLRPDLRPPPSGVVRHDWLARPAPSPGGDPGAPTSLGESRPCSTGDLEFSQEEPLLEAAVMRRGGT